MQPLATRRVPPTTHLALCTWLALSFLSAACPDTPRDDDPAADSGGRATAGKPAVNAGTPASGRGDTAGNVADGGATGAAGKPATAGASGHAGTGNDDDAGRPNAECGYGGAPVCASGKFCNYDRIGYGCGGTDAGGVCEARPSVCTEDFAPVCGCDLHSYDNACKAHAAGVAANREGLCSQDECVQNHGRVELSNGAGVPSCAANEISWRVGGTKDGAVCCVPPATPKQTCGGIAALKCKAGEFCDYETSAGGQGCDGKIADAAGSCERKPTSCGTSSQPVCGCDRRSYPNECSAHLAGASVLHADACSVSDCKARGGRAVAGIGPAPMCDSSEENYTSIVNDDGSLAIEGMICCVKK